MSTPQHIHLVGCPIPLGGWEAPPPAPAPSSPDQSTVSLTGSGIVWNGYGRYGGLRVTSHGGAGTLTVHGGPNNTFPIIHQVTEYTLGEWIFASGVTPNTEATYVEASSVYVAAGGTTQAVDYDVRDPEVA